MSESEKRTSGIGDEALGHLRNHAIGDTNKIIRELQERRAADEEFTGKPAGVSPELYAVFQMMIERHVDAFECLARSDADKTIAECGEGEVEHERQSEDLPGPFFISHDGKDVEIRDSRRDRGDQLAITLWGDRCDVAVGRIRNLLDALNRDACRQQKEESQ